MLMQLKERVRGGRSEPRRVMAAGLAGAVLAAAACSTSRPYFEKELIESYRREAGALAPSAQEARQAAEAGHALAASPVINEQSTLDDCVVYALVHNADVQAAYYRWQAQKERIVSAGSLPDPMAMIGRTLLRAEMRYAGGVSQMVPAWGKRELRRTEASQMADAGRQRFEAEALAVRYRVSSAWHEMQYLARAIELTQENITLLRSLETVAATRYQVAAADYADLIRIQIELAELEDRLAELSDRRNPLAANLNAAMNRPPDAPVPWGGAIEPMILDATVDQLLVMLRESNPELEEKDREIDAARTASEMARRERYPDFTIGVEIEDMREPMEGLYDQVLLSVSMNLPIWREKNEAVLGEAISRRLAVSAERRGLGNRLAAELSEAAFEHRDAHRRARLIRDTLLPRADQALESLLALYQAGRGGFLDILEAERTLIEFRLALERARTDRAVALARLDMLVGRPVPAQTETLPDKALTKPQEPHP